MVEDPHPLREQSHGETSEKRRQSITLLSTGSKP